MTTRNNTILYFGKSDAEHIAIRADEITGIGYWGGKANQLTIFFEGINNINGGEIRLSSVPLGKEREIVEEIISAINNPKRKYIDVINPTNGKKLHESLGTVYEIILDNEDFYPNTPLVESNVDTQDHTLTASDFLNGVVIHTSTTGAGTVTFPASSVITAAFTPALSSGDVIELIYVNDGTEDVTFAEDASSTVLIRNGSSPTIAANSACKIVMDVQAFTINAYILA